MDVVKLMTVNVVSCRPDDTLEEAVRVFRDHDCGCVPVVDDPGRVVGMLTDRDVCLAALAEGGPLDVRPIADVMSTEVHACKATDDVTAAAATMRTRQVRRLPVLDDGRRLVGILSLADLAREAARARHLPTTAVTDADVGETLAFVCGPRPAVFATEER